MSAERVTCGDRSHESQFVPRFLTSRSGAVTFGVANYLLGLKRMLSSATSQSELLSRLSLPTNVKLVVLVPRSIFATSQSGS